MNVSEPQIYPEVITLTDRGEVAAVGALFPVTLTEEDVASLSIFSIQGYISNELLQLGNFSVIRGRDRPALAGFRPEGECH